MLKFALYYFSGIYYFITFRYNFQYKHTHETGEQFRTVFS